MDYLIFLVFAFVSGAVLGYLVSSHVHSVAAKAAAAVSDAVNKAASKV